MAKKANGEGSINKYKHGWRATLSLGYDEKGKMVRKQFYSKTKIEAINKMNEYKDKEKRGLIPTNDKMTLEKWYSTWLFEFKANELRTSTIERYDVFYRNYVKETSIGRTKLKDLSAIMLQNYYNQLIVSGKTPYTVKMLHKVLKSCLKYAKRINYITNTFYENVVPPKVPYNDNDKFKVFTIEEQKEFMTAIKGHKYRIMFVTALGTGLRIGELVALKWNDIDFEQGIIAVDKSMSRAYRIVNGKRILTIEETTPKTIAGIRSVALPSNILNELKMHKEEQNKQKAMYLEIYHDKNFVFANELGGFILPDTLSKSYVKTLREAGIPHTRFHSLRHTYATRLFEKGVPLKTVQKLLGHSSIKITADIYTHVIGNEKISAVQKLNDLFEYE